MSPVDTSVPFTTRSAPMIEGAAARAARLCGCAAETGAAEASFLVENMSSSLDERARVSHHVVIPDFVVDVRPGAAPGRTKSSDRSSHRHVRSYLHQNGGQMAVACVDTETMVDFHHIAVAATLSGVDHRARSGGFDQRAPWSGKVDTGMKRILPGYRIEAPTEPARPLELRTADRRGQRYVTHCRKQRVHLIENGRRA